MKTLICKFFGQIDYTLNRLWTRSLAKTDHVVICQVSIIPHSKSAESLQLTNKKVKRYHSLSLAQPELHKESFNNI